MASHPIPSAFLATGRFLAVPWNAFVAAFVFYVVVTLVAIGVEQLPDAPMIAAYSLPVVAYAGIILSRALRGAAALTFHVGPAAIPKIV